MTNEEAIYILKNTAWLGTDNGIKVYPAIKKAIEALEKADKYKWHDLRKDPNDLPNNDEVVLCQHLPNIIEDKKELVIMHCFKDRKFVCNWDIDTDFHSKTFGKRYFGDVIAWREIEPFEEKQYDNSTHL